jgi:hypothetical protein
MSIPGNAVKGIAKCQPASAGCAYVWLLDAGATEPRYHGITTTVVTIGTIIAGYQVVNAREFQQILRANRVTRPTEERAYGIDH